MAASEVALDETDVTHLRHALAEAEAGHAEGGYPVGAVLARGAEVLSAGRNLTAQSRDPTAHGEVVCLRGAPPGDLSDATLYTTLSPCIMCAGTILWLGVGRVVIGDAEHYGGNEQMLRDRGVDVVTVRDPGCIALFERFLAMTPGHSFNC
jgi:cytosine deaminase